MCTSIWRTTWWCNQRSRSYLFRGRRWLPRNAADLPSWEPPRTYAKEPLVSLEIVEDSSGTRAMQRDPIEPSPAKHAANRAQRKHREQPVERSQLCLFELHRVAARALPPYPKQMRHPVGPFPACITHTFPSSCGGAQQIKMSVSPADPNSRPAMPG